ncbi:polyhydroxybutyrate depolymerase [Parafrankia irregularis]|uniref:Polyhydroxybutyrate depolymerase n=2 Tax=Parafrankia TaxID=2994362 RepID=A0A0S4QGT6_9ACTN|nr:PHB depolymerase family esterase [Parafrankia irregularis]CUU54701.1 polyhydroxybutyrate depolymerase [Parafrankia irregularis]
MPLQIGKVLAYSGGMSISVLRAHRRAVLGAALLMAAVLVALLVSCDSGARRSGPLRQRLGGSDSPSAPSQPGAGAPIPAGRSSFALTVAGAKEERTVHLYRPSGLTGQVPVVVMLHGGYGSGTQAENSYRWDDAADAGRFLAVFPDGTSRSWNAGGTCCGPAAGDNVDDVAFLRDVLATLGGRIDVDPRRVYVTGISNGGAMAYRMACETDLFAAVAAVSTTMLVDCSSAAKASVLHIHGTEDKSIRYDGEQGDPFSRRYPGIDGPPVPEVAAAWRAIDDCPQPSVTVEGVLTTSAAACPDGRAVELVTIDGAGHQWPGSDAKPLTQLLGADKPSDALDATTRIWDFFAAHPAPLR